MGKKWDCDVPSTEIWTECLRVLKPGGHLLAFAGTRTQHRMAVRIEDAGFEIRDMIAWVYGSGFPKSMDVSKAIDKMDGEKGMAIRKDIAKLIGLSGMSDKAISEEAGVSVSLARFWRRQERNIMPEQAEKLRSVLGNERLATAEREIIARAAGSIGRGSWREMEGRADQMPDEYDLTAPATEAARQWQGWGTALKPALEPITVARKPLIGTVAANVLAHGTGALNIDACRIATDDDPAARYNGKPARGENANAYGAATKRDEVYQSSPLGRWPANLIRDGCEPADLLGEAARFFYCAKASKKDRGDGNKHPTVKPTDLMAYLLRLVTPSGGTALDPFMGSGSTGKAAAREGFRFVGMERDEDSFETACQRVERQHAAIADDRAKPMQPDLLALDAAL